MARASFKMQTPALKVVSFDEKQRKPLSAAPQHQVAAFQALKLCKLR